MQASLAAVGLVSCIAAWLAGASFLWIVAGVLHLFGFFANLLSSTLSRQGLLHPALCARLQAEGVALHFLNDVFRLNLALESTESVLY